MTFENQLWITVADKFVIGLIVLVAGYWLNRRIEAFKSSEALREEIATLRAAAYVRLWKITEEAKVTRSTILTRAERNELRGTLTTWYFDQGNAMYLSYRAVQLFNEARNLLESEPDDKAIKNCFSQLRTQMKVDCGVYSKKDAKKKI